MCVIAISKKGSPMFKKDDVMNMFITNPDGAGVAWSDGKKVVMQKGFMEYKDLRNYLDTISDPEEKDIVLHCRIGTSGGNTPINCHPYPLKHKNNTLSGSFSCVMFHNGILDSYGFKGEREGENDTQSFIRQIINRLPNNFLKNQAIMKLIAGSIGGNRLCFLSRDGVKTVGKFIEEDGFSYSNTNWKKSSWNYTAPVKSLNSYPQYEYKTFSQPSFWEEADYLQEKFPSAYVSEIDEGYWQLEFFRQSDFQEAVSGLQKEETAGDPDFEMYADGKYVYNAFPDCFVLEAFLDA